MRTGIKVIALMGCFSFVLMDMRQIFDYKNLEGEVLILEKRQAELLRRHKQLLMSISVMSSFGRLESIAKDILKLQKLDSQQVKKIILLPPSKAIYEDLKNT